MNHDNEELAVIEGVGFGNRDCGRPVLWWAAKMLNCSTLCIFDTDEALKIIKESDCHDVHSLNGKTIVMRRDGNLARFVRLHK